MGISAGNIRYQHVAYIISLWIQISFSRIQDKSIKKPNGVYFYAKSEFGSLSN